MAFVYILFSKKLNRFYIGSCKDLAFRIEQHFNKDFDGSFTSKTDDWEVYFYINELEYKQARMIEAHIKKMRSKIYIQNLKQFPEMVNKLRAKFV